MSALLEHLPELQERLAVVLREVGFGAVENIIFSRPVFGKHVVSYRNALLSADDFAIRHGNTLLQVNQIPSSRLVDEVGR